MKDKTTLLAVCMAILILPNICLAADTGKIDILKTTDTQSELEYYTERENPNPIGTMDLSEREQGSGLFSLFYVLVLVIGVAIIMVFIDRRQALNSKMEGLYEQD